VIYFKQNSCFSVGIFVNLWRFEKILNNSYKILTMENAKLKELTDRLYGEGLEKGRAEADRLVAEAEAAAAKIVADAKAEAAKIVKEAEGKAADTAKNSMTEISLAGKQALAKIKNEIADAIIAKSVNAGVAQAVVDAAFVKELLLAVAAAWNGGAKVELKAMLPAALEAEFSKVFEASAKELLAAGIEVGYSNTVRNGFKVGQKDGGYYIAFTDESFAALMQEYLREKVAKLLF
jgi:V/A-type H+-transporting ATPase subunit E